MTKRIEAKFSNGHVDVYQGDREVRAAWMVIFPNGDIASGHSMDRAKAAKTAAGHIRFVPGRTSVDRPRAASADAHAYHLEMARSRGFKSWKEDYADFQNKLAAYRAQCKVEVIDLCVPA